MVCSPEQLAANRRNAKRSCGPRTAEGKAKSRRNGLKHGLTGAGVVIPDEDVEEVAGRFEAFEADLKPANDVARFLASRAALLSVRLDRSAREEAARITVDMIEAGQSEEDDRLAEVDRLMKSLADEPSDSIRKLRRSAEGIDRLIESWRELGRDLLRQDGASWSHEAMHRLAGRKPEWSAGCRVAALTRARRGDFCWLDGSDWPDLPPAGRREAAVRELAAIIDREIAGLEEARESLDHESIARARAGAAARAIFNSSRDATLARKYEAAAERGFFRALEQIEAINEAAAGPAQLEENPERDETCNEMASSFPGRTGRAARGPRSDRQAAAGHDSGAGGGRSARGGALLAADH